MMLGLSPDQVFPLSPGDSRARSSLGGHTLGSAGGEGAPLTPTRSVPGAPLVVTPTAVPRHRVTSLPKAMALGWPSHLPAALLQTSSPPAAPSPSLGPAASPWSLLRPAQPGPRPAKGSVFRQCSPRTVASGRSQELASPGGVICTLVAHLRMNLLRQNLVA